MVEPSKSTIIGSCAILEVMTPLSAPSVGRQETILENNVINNENLLLSKEFSKVFMASIRGL